MRSFSTVFCVFVFISGAVTTSAASSEKAHVVVLSEQVAGLVKLLLDLREQSINECGEPGSPSKCIGGEAYDHERVRTRRFEELLHGLTRQPGKSGDEALVTLMCFYIGESEEELDAVIKRGKRMLPLLEKYKQNTPVIRDKRYPHSMYKASASKKEYFDGAIEAIKAGRHSSAE
jgi:hypothetical protein